MRGILALYLVIACLGAMLLYVSLNNGGACS